MNAPSLAQAAATVQNQTAADADPWAGASNEWIRRLTSRKKGAAGERIVRTWLAGHGHQVDKPTSSEHDLVADGVKVEVKLSTLWADGTLRFQQLRDQDYDQVLLLGVWPETMRAWLVPKQVLWDRATSQHAGAAGTDTRWLGFDAHDPPAWLAEHQFDGTAL